MRAARLCWNFSQAPTMFVSMMLSPSNHTDGLPVGEVFSKPEGISNPAFPFLVGVVDVF